MKKTTRREFVETSLKTGAGLAALCIIPGCESVTIDEQRSAGPSGRFLTDVDNDWFYYSGIDLPRENVPIINAADWVLNVTTGGESVGEINYQVLKSLEAAGEDVSYLKTLRCINGAYVQEVDGVGAATGLFRGIPLARALDETFVSPEATKLRLIGDDGFRSSIVVDRVNDEERLPVMLAYELNGSPIPPEFGGPVRLIAPEMWAFKCVKWITRIEATSDFSTYGTFEEGDFGGQGFIDNPAEVALSPLITSPTKLSAEVGSDLTVEGMALVGGSRITQIQFSVDGGLFENVEVFNVKTLVANMGHLGLLVEQAEQFGSPYPYQDIWVPFRFQVEGLTPGMHSVAVRATDGRDRSNVASPEQPRQVAPLVSLQLSVT